MIIQIGRANIMLRFVDFVTIVYKGETLKNVKKCLTLFMDNPLQGYKSCELNYYNVCHLIWLLFR